MYVYCIYQGVEIHGNNCIYIAQIFTFFLPTHL